VTFTVTVSIERSGISRFSGPFCEAILGDAFDRGDPRHPAGKTRAARLGGDERRSDQEKRGEEIR